MPEVTRAEQQARAALRRATEAQKSSDSKVKSCAPIYAETALEWARFRNELAQLAALQVKVRRLQKRVSDAQAALKREQAYLEETEARRGRALATLEQLKANASPPPSSLKTPNATSTAPESTPGGKSPVLKGPDGKKPTAQGQK